MRRLLITAAARLDMLDAAAWYDAERPGLGRAFLGELDLVLPRIEETPYRYPVMTRAIRRARLHRFPYGVFFMVEDEMSVVIACLHASRAPSVWMGRA